jgi:hypothetical protein
MTKRIIKTKEDDEGVWDFVAYTDNPQDLSGYWVKREAEWKQELRVPLGCRACGTFLMNWDTQFVHRYGVCANCYVDWLEGRENLPEFRGNADMVAYCKAKIEEKNTKKQSQP